MRKSQGFTILELVLVLVLIGLLAVIGLPRLFNVASSAKDNTRETTLLAIRQGIEHYHIGDLLHQQTGAGNYPTTLDSAPNGVTCNPCFTEVIEGGLFSPLWSKLNPTQYIYNDNNNAPITYTYNPETGTFE